MYSDNEQKLIESSYKLLELNMDDSIFVIRNRYMKLLKLANPDRIFDIDKENGWTKDDKKLATIRIMEAYNIISNDVKFNDKKNCPLELQQYKDVDFIIKNIDVEVQEGYKEFNVDEEYHKKIINNGYKYDENNNFISPNNMSNDIIKQEIYEGEPLGRELNNTIKVIKSNKNKEMGMDLIEVKTSKSQEIGADLMEVYANNLDFWENSVKNDDSLQKYLEKDEREKNEILNKRYDNIKDERDKQNLEMKTLFRENYGNEKNLWEKCI